MATEAVAVASGSARGGPEFYAPKPVPPHMQSLIRACVEGDVEAVRVLWRPGMYEAVRRLARDDTCHPLLNAAHHLRVEVVEFLLERGLNPRQRGTVHPYTGDNMIVAECQGISPLELIDKMLFMHARKSKRRDAILAVRDRLRAADENFASQPVAAGDAAASEDASLFVPAVNDADEGDADEGGDHAAAVFITPSLPRTLARTGGAPDTPASPVATTRGVGATPGEDAAEHRTPATSPADMARAAADISVRALSLTRMPVRSPQMSGGASTPSAASSKLRPAESVTPPTAAGKRRTDAHPLAVEPRTRGGTLIVASKRAREDMAEESVASAAAPPDEDVAERRFVTMPTPTIFQHGPKAFSTPPTSSHLRVLDRPISVSVSEMWQSIAMALAAGMQRWLATAQMPSVTDALGRPAVVMAAVGAPTQLTLPDMVGSDTRIVLYRFTSLRELLQHSTDAFDRTTTSTALSEFMQLMRHRWQPSSAPRPASGLEAEPMRQSTATTRAAPLSPEIAKSARVLLELAAAPRQPDEPMPFLLRHLGPDGYMTHPLGISPHLLVHDDPAVPKVRPTMPSPPQRDVVRPPTPDAVERSSPALRSQLLFAGRTPVSFVLAPVPDSLSMPSLQPAAASAVAFRSSLERTLLAVPEALPGLTPLCAYERSARPDNVSSDSSDVRTPASAASASADWFVSRDTASNRLQVGFAPLALFLRSLLGSLILDTRIHVLLPLLRVCTSEAASVPVDADAAHMLWAATLANMFLQRYGAAPATAGSSQPLSSALGHRFAVEHVAVDRHTPVAGVASGSHSHDVVLVMLRLCRVA